MTFDIAASRLLPIEGEYVNDPNDPGGETKYGISKRSYPNVDIKNLTLEAAKEIYKRDVWDRIDGVPDKIKYQVFDFAVNSGVETAIRYLQRAVGVADDGHWGPVSKSAADGMTEYDIMFYYTANRINFQTKLKNWPSAGKGWSNRNAANLRFAAQDI